MVGEAVFQQFKSVKGLRKGSGKTDPLTRKANFTRRPNPSTAPVLAWVRPVIEIITIGAPSPRLRAVSGGVGR